MSATTLDPRPDLADDHNYWEALLARAEAVDKEICGTLKGMRALGARLTFEGNKLHMSPRNGYGVDCYPIPTHKDAVALYAQHRQRYLLPHKSEIMGILALASLDVAKANE